MNLLAVIIISFNYLHDLICKKYIIILKIAQKL